VLNVQIEGFSFPRVGLRLLVEQKKLTAFQDIKKPRNLRFRFSTIAVYLSQRKISLFSQVSKYFLPVSKPFKLSSSGSSHLLKQSKSDHMESLLLKKIISILPL